MTGGSVVCERVRCGLLVVVCMLAIASDTAMAVCTDRYGNNCRGGNLGPYSCDLSSKISSGFSVYVCCAARCTPRVLLIVEWCVQLHATVDWWRGVVCAVPLCILRLA